MPGEGWGPEWGDHGASAGPWAERRRSKTPSCGLINCQALDMDMQDPVWSLIVLG